MKFNKNFINKLFVMCCAIISIILFILFYIWNKEEFYNKKITN